MHASQANTLQKPYLTVHDLAALLGCSPKAIYHRVARGQLVAMRLGKTILFDQKSLVTQLRASRF